MFVCLSRAYRIGQCRDVTVLRLISLGTVEEVIYLRQVYKQVPDNYDNYSYGDIFVISYFFKKASLPNSNQSVTLQKTSESGFFFSSFNWHHELNPNASM